MFTSALPFRLMLLVFFLLAGTAKADSFGGGVGWGNLARVLLAVGSCQNRLQASERAACFKRNSQQACQFAPEGIEKENCIKEYSYSAPPPARSPAGSGAGFIAPLAMQHTPQAQIPEASTGTPDELDSKMQIFLHEHPPVR